MKACEELANNHEIRAAVVNFASIKPLDIAAVVKAAKTGLIVTAEDHHIDTGLGSLVAAIMAENSLSCRLVRLGVTRYGYSGKPEELYRAESINRQGIVKAVVQARTTVDSKK